MSANRSRPAPAASRRHRQAVPCCGRGAVAGGYSVTVRHEGALRSCFPGDGSPPPGYRPSWRSLRTDPAVFSRADGSRHLACTASCADAAPDTRTRTILGATVDQADSRAGAAAPEGVAGQAGSHNSGGNRPAGVHFRPDRHQNSNNANFAPKRVFQWNTPCSRPSTAQISGYGAFFNPQTS